MYEDFTRILDDAFVSKIKENMRSYLKKYSYFFRNSYSSNFLFSLFYFLVFLFIFSFLIFLIFILYFYFTNNFLPDFIIILSSVILFFYFPFLFVTIFIIVVFLFMRYRSVLFKLIKLSYYSNKNFLYSNSSDPFKVNFFNNIFKPVKIGFVFSSEIYKEKILETNSFKKEFKNNASKFNHCFNNVWGSFNGVTFSSGTYVFYHADTFISNQDLGSSDYNFFAFKIPFSLKEDFSFFISGKIGMYKDRSFDKIFDFYISKNFSEEKDFFLNNLGSIKEELVNLYFKYYLYSNSLTSRFYIFTYNNWLFLFFKDALIFYPKKLKSCLLKKPYVYVEDIDNYARSFEKILDVGVKIVDILKYFKKV